ncbi:hypothetical protein LX32DRAFT_38271 [Colletotrichum zoysiae]|uniref:Transmembrane protein n=1 Tax=Colletotrichum zoysiae TaxID=1216348 RepID=A0AAD9HBJ7_9PEZI|nr:hypothetical protein LX32DRAFT_38271 [Colletotrichum zoysiae]
MRHIRRGDGETATGHCQEKGEGKERKEEEKKKKGGGGEEHRLLVSRRLDKRPLVRNMTLCSALRQKSLKAFLVLFFFFFFFQLARARARALPPSPFVSSCRFDAETRAPFNPKKFEKRPRTRHHTAPHRLFFPLSLSLSILACYATQAGSGSSCDGPRWVLMVKLFSSFS